MFDKIMQSFKPKAKEETKVEEPKKEQGQVQKPVTKELDPVVVGEWENKLVNFVYDEELAKELAPIFAKLSDAEGFDKVLELLDTKEKQIEAISAGSKQQSNPDQKQEQQEVKPQTATDILKARNKQSK